MLKNILTEELVSLDAAGLYTPEEVIRYSGQLLVNAGRVEPEYVEKMIEAFQDLGPYIVVAPGIAMPHAHLGSNVKRMGISFVRLEKPVFFGHPENDPVSLVFALAAKEHDDHIHILQELGELLGNDDKKQMLTAVSDYYELYELL